MGKEETCYEIANANLRISSKGTIWKVAIANGKKARQMYRTHGRYNEILWQTKTNLLNNVVDMKLC